MTYKFYHIGSDEGGYSFYSLSKCNIGLGHRMLSILDLSSHGHQSMKFDNLEIVYNGKAYNFKENRNDHYHMRFEIRMLYSIWKMIKLDYIKYSWEKYFEFYINNSDLMYKTILMYNTNKNHQI